RTPSDYPLAQLDQATTDHLAGTGHHIEDIYPLTPMQAGMTFHSLSPHEEDIYLEQTDFILDGVADPDILAAAWQHVTDRTPVLRTAIAWENVPRPLQVVHRAAALPITRLDWTGLDDPARQAALDHYLEHDRAAGLDLTAPPLMRLAIARLSPTQVHLIWTFHHLLLDGWSAAQFFNEVCGQYAAAVGGHEAAVVDRRPFRDYLDWLSRQDPAHAETYWRRALAGLDTPTPLPYDRPPAEAHRGSSSETVQVTLPPGQSTRLREVAQHNGLTLNTVIQGAWGLLLSRYTGRRDVVFGSTVSGRPPDLDGAESIIGLFINTVPTRLTVPGSQRVISWLHDLQVQQAESRRFDFVSLAQLRAWCDLPGGTGLFDSMVVFENYPFDRNAIAAHGLEMREICDLQPTNYPLSVVAVPGHQLSVVLDYDPALFDTATVERMAGHLQVLLAAIAADPGQLVGDIELAAPAERAQVLTAGTGPAREVPTGTFPELFQAQAARTPDATALVAGPAQLTYAELN